MYLQSFVVRIYNVTYNGISSTSSIVVAMIFSCSSTNIIQNELNELNIFSLLSMVWLTIYGCFYPIVVQEEDVVIIALGNLHQIFLFMAWGPNIALENDNNFVIPIKSLTSPRWSFGRASSICVHFLQRQSKSNNFFC